MIIKTPREQAEIVDLSHGLLLAAIMLRNGKPKDVEDAIANLSNTIERLDAVRHQLHSVMDRI